MLPCSQTLWGLTQTKFWHHCFCSDYPGQHPVQLDPRVVTPVTNEWMSIKGPKCYQHAFLSIPELLPFCKDTTISPHMCPSAVDDAELAMLAMNAWVATTKGCLEVNLSKSSITASLGVFFWKQTDFVEASLSLSMLTSNMASLAGSKLFLSTFHEDLRVIASQWKLWMGLRELTHTD